VSSGGSDINVTQVACLSHHPIASELEEEICRNNVGILGLDVGHLALKVASKVLSRAASIIDADAASLTMLRRMKKIQRGLYGGRNWRNT
jgi:hypothetical protein